MKIVAKQPIRMKIDHYIDDLAGKGVEVVRIELSSEEFLELWRSCQKEINNSDILWYCGLPQSGSYLVYRGVCVQYHRDYAGGDCGIEYI